MLFHRGQHAQITLHPSGVVIMDIGLNHLDKFMFAGKPSAVIAFPLQNAPEALHRAVINAMRHAGHTLRHFRLHELVVESAVGVLESSVAMEQGMRVRIGFHSLIKGLENQRIVIAFAELIGHDAPVAKVEDGAQIEFLYHLHVVYIPVVEKQILWSKRCKDKSLIGTVKETIMQVSSSKKWISKPALDEHGNPMLTAKGKPILKKSYSVLQDDFFNAMRTAGYTDVQRGERGSTEEHLTVTQFKVQAEQERLEAVTGLVAQAEQTLEDTQAAADRQKKRLAVLQKETKTAKTAALTIQDIEAMGKKNALTGNISLTPLECDTLKQHAINGIAARADNRRLKEKMASAEQSATIWKQRFEALNEKYQELKKKAQPYLDALEIASERVRAFLNIILARGQREHNQPAHKRGQDIEI